MTFRTKGHNKQQQQQRSHDEDGDDDHQHQQQQLRPVNNSLHQQHRNHSDKTNQLTAPTQPSPPSQQSPPGADGSDGGRPATVTLAAAPKKIAQPGAGGTPRIYATAYGPRCYVVQKVLTTPSNSSGALNPEAHEFKYKSLAENQSKPGEESNENNSKNGKKNKVAMLYIRTCGDDVDWKARDVQWWIQKKGTGFGPPDHRLFLFIYTNIIPVSKPLRVHLDLYHA